MIILYALLIVCIACATIIEKVRGTAFVSDYIYGSWWFSALWAVLTVTSLAYILQRRLYMRLAVFLLHIAFVVILAGALTTHLFARRGSVRLRTSVAEYTFTDQANKVVPLPFSLTLKEFRIVNYPGTDAPLDYQSVVHYSFHDKREGEVLVSMNSVGHINGYRLFQSSYDSDGEGVTLGVSYDPYGITITYAGYLMLLLGIIATLLSRHTQMRALYRKATTLVLLLVVSMSVQAEDKLPVIDKDIAQRMGTIHVLYNNRICPLNTVATDFVMKMTGSATWHGYSADEIFFSWMIYYSPWEKELLLNNTNRKGANEREAVAAMFYNGQLTKIFPYRIANQINWYSPGGQVLPREIPVKVQFFIKQSMDFLTESIVTGQRERAFEIIAKIKLFQRDMIGNLLPSESMTKAELFYNTLRSQKWPVFLALTLSFLFFLKTFKAPTSSFIFRKNCAAVYHYSFFFFHFSFFIIHYSFIIYVSLQLALRWWLSGHIPVSNGPETMLFMAWVLLLLPILYLFISHRSSIINSRSSLLIPQSSFFIASFCLLVAMLGGSSSQITPLMPVLQSPLLSVHVMTVMCAYALFALQALLGIQALIQIKRNKDRAQGNDEQLDRITALSRFLLYPAVFLLTVGIFLGAVWANVSWGNYWSWAPKEAWALITLLVYAVPLHRSLFNVSKPQSISLLNFPSFHLSIFQFLNSPTFLYHLYMVSAFLTVVFTYFGVNYLLGGMHSYA